MDMCGVEDGLFDIPTHQIEPGQLVEVIMPWGPAWTCEVVGLSRISGWPAAELRHGQEVFKVDVARCRVVG